jgi:hypothetical protein
VRVRAGQPLTDRQTVTVLQYSSSAVDLLMVMTLSLVLDSARVCQALLCVTLANRVAARAELSRCTPSRLQEHFFVLR